MLYKIIFGNKLDLLWTPTLFFRYNNIQKSFIIEQATGSHPTQTILRNLLILIYVPKRLQVVKLSSLQNRVSKSMLKSFIELAHWFFKSLLRWMAYRRQGCWERWQLYQMIRPLRNICCQCHKTFFLVNTVIDLKLVCLSSFLTSFAG